MPRSVKFYFALFFLLVMFGMVMVFNIKVFVVNRPDAQVLSILRGQILNLCIAGAGFIAAYLMNIDVVRSWIKYLLLFIILLLLATFVIGTEVNGSTRWINLHFMMIQPSEFAKLVVIFYLAEVICNKRERMGLWQELVYPFGLVSALVLVIAVEDLGTALIIFATSLTLMLMGGMRFKYFAALIALSLLVVTILILMKPYRLERIKVWRDPWKYKQAQGYQQVQSEIALGRGGATGVGFGNSQRKLRYLPEASTDFIFAIVGEEFGFVGAALFIIALIVLFITGVYFALSRGDPFSLYLAAGIVLILGIQAAVNLGVVTSTLPNKGVPLPFISYGGSSLLSSCLMIGFLLNVVVTDSRSQYQ
ncbi:MAG TPA: putative peptidoglycan glycosyltransferase FtsW [bacterium]|nr:putative peptidoglycan glycosyltransferase FtsW [bacterium]